VTEQIVHVLGDPGPFPQPGLLGDQPLLTFQVRGAFPSGAYQFPVLTDEPSGAPGQDDGTGEHGDETVAVGDPVRDCAHGDDGRDKDGRRRAGRDTHPGGPPPREERGQCGGRAPPGADDGHRGAHGGEE